jgi:hypothetical protein
MMFSYLGSAADNGPAGCGGGFCVGCDGFIDASVAVPVTGLYIEVAGVYGYANGYGQPKGGAVITERVPVARGAGEGDVPAVFDVLIPCSLGRLDKQFWIGHLGGSLSSSTIFSSKM